MSVAVIALQKLAKVSAFDMEFTLKEGLVVNVVVEVVFSDIQDSIAKEAVTLRGALTLDAACLLHAFLNINASLTGTFIGAHVSVDRVNVVVDDVLAVQRGVLALRII